MSSKIELAATILICSACTSAAYALNPTGRYLVEMGRLIRDPQLQQLNSVAAPVRPDETSESDLTKEKEDNHTPSIFDGTMPTQARRKLLEVTLQSLDDNNSADETGYDLFDALDRHLRALDEQIDTSSSISSALDKELSSLEVEYDSEESEFSTHLDQTATFYEEPTDSEIHYPSHSSAFARSPNYAVLVTQPDTAFNDETTGDEFSTQSSHLDDAQTLNNAHIIGTDSFGFSTIHAEAAHSFETYKPKYAQFTSIQHMKGPPPLPETSSPYELLGFSYHNPPKDADDIRRAYVKRAKKYHPDAIHPASNDDEREMAARNFKRINDAYRKLKDEKFRLQDEYFATTMGGAMYEPRGSSRHIRRPFSYGRGFDESESAFSGSYSARHGAKFGETKRFWEKRKAYDDYQRREQRPTRSGRERKNPFGGRHEVRDNCHVDVDFPPF